jgi:Flp pilus assembly pilin Flp
MSLCGKWFRHSSGDEPRTFALEWSLILGLLLVSAIIAIALVGPKVSDMWSNVDVPAPASTNR